MKYLSGLGIAVLGLVLGVLVAAAVHSSYPSLPVQEVLAERQRLEAELLRHIHAPAGLSVHQQWQKLQQYIDLYQQLSLNAVGDESTASADELDAIPWPWQGVLSGPAADIILVSRSLQAIAAVRFKRLSVEQGQASLVLSLVGGP